MLNGRDLTTLTLAHAGARLNHTFVLPIVVLLVTSRCNSRCQSCAWWTSDGHDDLSADEVARIAGDLARLGTRLVVFSGGEPLLRPDVFVLADHFRRRGIALHLLTSGLALKTRASDVARRFSRVVVSLDAATEADYRFVRGVAGFDAVRAGVAALRAVAPSLPVTARATLHRHNFRALIPILDAARDMGVDQVSFLAADVTSDAFGPRHGPDRAALRLTAPEAREFAHIVEQCVADRADAFRSGFVAESPDKLRRLPQYYAALLGQATFPPVSCNAPSMSAVIEADGRVRPCFFHPPVGTLRETPLQTLVTRHLQEFRASWDPAANAICERCVCTLKVGWRTPPWS